MWKAALLIFLSGQKCHKAVTQDAQKSGRYFHPMLQIYVMFLYNTYEYECANLFGFYFLVFIDMTMK